MTDKEYKMDIKEVLSALDLLDMEYYGKLTEEQQASISMWTLMRFMGSTQAHPDYHIMMTNLFTNVNFSLLSKHPELQWKLLCLGGSGKKQYHPWVAPPRAKGKSKAQAFLATIHRGANKEELALLESMYTHEELVDMVMATGLSKQEANKVV